MGDSVTYNIKLNAIFNSETKKASCLVIVRYLIWGCYKSTSLLHFTFD
jgi:hypothetical protein